MKKNIFLIAFTSVILLLVATACNKEEDDAATVPICDGSIPTYNNTAKAIVDANCISCHGTGSYKGDFTSYSKLETYLTNNTFNNRVVTLQDMPQSGALSDADLNKLQCWVENGYPEN